jgi:ATP-dependent Clp protease ATP-binding subunit ClpA
MSSLLEKMSRWMPLFMGIMALAVIIQVSNSLGIFVHDTGILAWVGTHAWAVASTLGSAAVMCWLLVYLSYLRARNRLPQAIGKWSWLMDILDRLTNREALQRRLQAEVKPVSVDAQALAEAMKSKVVGQNAICDDLAAQIRRRLALTQRGKPVGVFLFAGPPGSGKTYLGKTLASALGRKLLHFDMTQYATAGFGATSLFGASKGYVGSTSYGKLTGSLRDTPDAVVLLDEFEKAHGDVHKNFLTAWNDGFITETSDGRQISTTTAIFVLTTNAAVETLADLSRQYAAEPDELRRAAVSALRAAGFAPEVLNRIDRIFVFEPLADLDIARVAALEIEQMIVSYGLTITQGGIDPQILIDLMNRQKKMGLGASARDLVRVIEESIADALIEAKQRGVTSISLEDRGGEVHAAAAAS